MGNPHKTIEWTVPKAWHLQKVRADLRGVFTLGVFARIILISVSLAVGIWYLVEKALGPLEFNWIRGVALSVLSGLGVLFVGAAVSCFPPTIRIGAKGIAVVKGQESFVVAFKDVTDISVVDSAIPVLKFRKGTRDFRYAIAQSVDIEQLRQELQLLTGRSVPLDPHAKEIQKDSL